MAENQPAQMITTHEWIIKWSRWLTNTKPPLLATINNKLIEHKVELTPNFKPN